MGKNPLVSVVIPVYNGANYMREAIDSALTQNYPNVETIVVNDGSTDNTREIALSYGDRIRYFEKENGGVSTALNLAIQEMRGEYFSWLSHDDVYYPNKIQTEIDALKKNGDMSRVVYSGFDALIMPERRIVPYNGNQMFQYMKKRYMTIGAVAPIMGFISGCTLLIHRRYFEEFGEFDQSLRCVQDYVKWFQMFRGNSLLYVPEKLIKQRFHKEQVTHLHPKMRQEETWLWKWMMESLEEKDMISTGLTVYQVLGEAMKRMQDCAFWSAYDVIVKRLQALIEPSGSSHMRRRFSDYLTGNGTRDIYLYCAGNRAESLILALWMRDIDIKGISDSNPEKWGKPIRWLVCVPPSEIPKNALVIVTKHDPLDVMELLKKNGYTNVSSYDILRVWLLDTPIKKDLLSSAW